MGERELERMLRKHEWGDIQLQIGFGESFVDRIGDYSLSVFIKAKHECVEKHLSFPLKYDEAKSLGEYFSGIYCLNGEAIYRAIEEKIEEFYALCYIEYSNWKTEQERLDAKAKEQEMEKFAQKVEQFKAVITIK